MKKIICLVLSIIAITSTVLPFGTVAFAKDPVKTKTISYTDFATHNDVVGKDGFQYNFKLGSNSAIYAEFDISVNKNKIGYSYAKKLDGKNGYKFYLISLNGEQPQVVQKADILISKNNYTEKRVVTSSKVLTAGKYTAFVVPCRNNYIAQIMKCKFRMYTYSGFAEQSKLPTALTVNTNAVKKISLTEPAPSNTIAAAKWATSDKTVAKIITRGKNFVEVSGVKPGKCVISATLKNGTQYNCKITVKNPNPAINEKSLVMQTTTAKNLKVLYTKRNAVWSSTDKAVATVNAKGRVTAKSAGTCKIISRCGGKNYVCKVKVVTAKPEFVATLVSYNKKSNYFIVKYINNGVKPLKIISNGAACMADKDSLTRHLYLKGNKNLVINPGAAKSVKFFVDGKTTSAKISRYGIMYNFTYAGKTYLSGVWCEDSTYKLGKKWKPTYTYPCDMYRIQGLEYTI